MAELQPHPHRGIFRRHPHEVARPSTTSEAQAISNTSVSEPIIDGTLVYPPTPLKQPGRVSGRTAAVALGSLIAAGAVGLGTLYGVIQSRNGDSPTSSTTTTENSGGVAGTPPPTSREGGAIATTPTTIPKTPEATPTPNVSPMETALNAGIIELRNSGDWEKYFTIISPEEADKLLQDANSAALNRDQYRVLLPFDPRNSPSLVIEEFTNPLSGTKNIGFDNIAPGTKITATLTGTTKSVVGYLGSTKGVVTTSSDGKGNFSAMVFHADNVSPQTIPESATKTGDIIQTISTNPTSAPIYTDEKFQGAMQVAYQEKIARTMRISNFLIVGGKIAFIGAPQK